MRSFVLVEERLRVIGRWLERPVFLYLEWYPLCFQNHQRYLQSLSSELTPSSSSLETSSSLSCGSTVRTCEDTPKRRCFGPLGLWGLRLRFGGPLPSPWCVTKSELNENSTIKAYQVSSESWSTLEHSPKQHLCLTWLLSSTLNGAYIGSVRSHVAWVSSNNRRQVLVVLVQPGFGPCTRVLGYMATNQSRL